MTEFLKSFLQKEKTKIAAMKHWDDQSVERGHYPTYNWEEGPYPVMLKLIRMNEILLSSCEAIAQDSDYYPSAAQAIKECQEILDG